jgi:hypothetical protein
MNEILNYFLVFIFGAGGLAVINIFQKRWEMKYERKTKKEDRQEMKEDKLDEFGKKLDDFLEKQKEINEDILKKQKETDKQLMAQSQALKLDLLDRIFHLANGYIKQGEITFDERRRLHEMHDCYHNGLGGNGDADLIMKEVDELPLKTTEVKG